MSPSGHLSAGCPPTPARPRQVSRRVQHPIGLGNRLWASASASARLCWRGSPPPWRSGPGPAAAQQAKPEQKAHGSSVWAQPMVQLRLPVLSNVRSDPFERSQHEAGDYVRWFVEHAFVLVPAQSVVAGELRAVPARNCVGDRSASDEIPSNRRAKASYGLYGAFLVKGARSTDLLFFFFAFLALSFVRPRRRLSSAPTARCQSRRVQRRSRTARFFSAARRAPLSWTDVRTAACCNDRVRLD
jgi:hypothetical protein